MQYQQGNRFARVEVSGRHSRTECIALKLADLGQAKGTALRMGRPYLALI